LKNNDSAPTTASGRPFLPPPDHPRFCQHPFRPRCRSIGCTASRGGAAASAASDDDVGMVGQRRVAAITRGPGVGRLELPPLFHRPHFGAASLQVQPMDYYQGVVVEYLHADRAIFVNTECCIQLDDCRNVDRTKHWYCDAGNRTVFLCETTFTRQPAALIRRLIEWHDKWPDVLEALKRDSCLRHLRTAGNSGCGFSCRPSP
jgi:hypothetical protein